MIQLSGKNLFFSLLLLLTIGSQAAGPLLTEVIPLHYRSAEELLPMLRPLVPRPGTVTGMRYQLIVRATEQDIAELRSLLLRLDQAPRQLLIKVRRGTASHRNSSNTEAFGRTGGNVHLETGRHPTSGGGLTLRTGDDKQNAGVRIRRTRGHSDESSVQQIRVLNGQEAFIRSGQSVPFGQRQVIVSGRRTSVHGTIQYKDVTTGFYVIPRLSGERVVLNISPRSARLSHRGGGAIDIQQAQTTLAGRLGEWILIGGSSRRSSDTESGITHATTARGDESKQIWLKVEELAGR